MKIGWLWEELGKAKILKYTKIKNKMVTFQSQSNPVSIVKEGLFRGNILEKLVLFKEGFKYFPAKETHEKYGLYIPETPALIVVSRLKGNRVHHPNGTNLYASFTSYSNRTNLELIKEFETKTGIKIPYNHPSSIAIGMLMNMFFQEVGRSGPKTIEMLSQF